MMKKTSNEKKRILYIILVVSTILLVAAVIRIYDECFASNVRSTANGKFLYCYTGLDFSEQSERIKSQQVLKHPDALFRILRLTGYDQMIKPGRYKLQESMSNFELLKLIVSGKQETFDVVLKQAESTHEIAAFFGEQLEADSNAIESIVNGNIPFDSLALDSNNTLLLFIPDTYNFYWNTSPEKLIQRMINAHQHFWDSTRIKKANLLGLQKWEIGTLASIVQKESNKIDEMPTIAGVYYNRIHHNMPLQADPTIIFAMHNKQIRRVAGAMLNIESPYNTYTHIGLPPGPICLPSVQAIDAVLNLKHHHYLYFCASEDFTGYHRFAQTFEQHQRNARKYQQALNRKGIK